MDPHISSELDIDSIKKMVDEMPELLTVCKYYKKFWV